MLTPEQIQQFRQQYNVGPSSAQPQTAEERVANLRNSLKRNQEVEEHKATPEGKSFFDKFKSFSGGFVRGAQKGVISTIGGTAELGERSLRGAFKALLPKKAEEKLGLTKPFQPSLEKLVGKETLERETTPEGTAEKTGFIAEQIAEFLLPASRVAKVSKVISGIGGTSKLAGVGRLAGRSALEASAIGGQTAIQRGEVGDDAKTAAIIGAVFPVGGAVFSGLKKSLKPIGQKIQTTVIRPNAKDLADGFKIENLTKYNIGGSLAETATKVHIKLNEFGKQLQVALKDSNASINLNKVFQKTEDALLKVSKSEQFGDIGATRRVLEQLKSEIDEVVGSNGLIDLIEGTNIKRGAGTKGAWAFNRPEPNSSAIEKVYTNFYNKIKNAIEKASPNDIKGINKKISDLIPISNATIRRLPVEQRNNVISLTESIGLFASIFDPRALAVIGASRLSKSGKFAQFLINVANRTPKTDIGKRIFNPRDPL